MEWIHFEKLSLLTAAGIFLAAAIVVWIVGGKLSALADQMAEETGLGRAFIGVLVLGGITSLPEVATTVTASLAGNAGMAVSNVLGGVSMQITILAVVDFWVRKQPLSTATSATVLGVQAGCVILMLAFTAVFMLLPSVPVFFIGLDTLLIFLIFLFSLYLVHRFSAFQWISYDQNNKKNVDVAINKLHKLNQVLDQKTTAPAHKMPIGIYLRKKGSFLVLFSILILVAGFFVVKASESIAAKTGISTSFAGLVMVAITTSLPEISTTIGSVKRRRYDMAFSNIFGTNLFDVALLFVADLLYFRGPVLDGLTNFTVVAAMHGIILTSIFLVGILIRNKKVVLHIGYDSLIILLVYLGGIALLYSMSG